MSGLQISDYRKRTPALARQCFEDVFALFEAGKIKPPPSRCFPLDQAGDALTALLDRSVPERIVLVP